MNIVQLKLLLRNLKRNKLHSLINVIGFALGIAAFIVIVLFANSQFSFDGFHSNQNKIYKLYLGNSGGIPAPVINQLKDKFPDIEDGLRYTDWYGGGEDGYITTNNTLFKCTDLLFADESFFDFFDFKSLEGDVKTALQHPNSILLSESMAKKLFGDNNPVGQPIAYKSKGQNIEYSLTVTGVIKDAPFNSSIQYNGIVSMNTIVANNIRRGRLESDWGNWGFNTFIKATNLESIKSDIEDFWAQSVKERLDIDINSEVGKEYQLSFVPLKQIHFHNTNKRSLLYVLLFIGFVILAIAIVNYVNLSITLFNSRVKEVGVKKIVGSGRSGLFWLFINESVLITLISSLLAVLLIFVLHPVFSHISGMENILDHKVTIPIIMFFLLGIIFIGTISGIYPAVYLTSLKPMSAFRNEVWKSKRRVGVKYSLVVFQFAVSIALIVSVLVISGQLKFMQSQKLGFSPEQIIYFTQSNEINKHYDSFKQALTSNPGIESVCRTNHHMGMELNMTTRYKINGKYKTYYATTIDPDFIKTMGIELLSGRNISWKNQADRERILINEKFAKDFELDNPIGTKIDFFDHDMEIVGVIKNFHNNSLQHEIKPCIYCNLDWNSCINVRVSTQNIEGSITAIKKTWQQFSPGIPFEYSFLNKTFDKLYRSEKEFGILMKAFSILAICIACLGLFGLISYSTLQRSKEIGIRKVNGAKITEVMTMLNKDVVKWVALAFLIATPVAYYAMNKWLENFAYKTNLSWWIFALSGFLALGIALLTVSFQSWKAATRNPVEALRYE
ncbi:ABC transporter permease [Saccharicrinis sp. FJH2]|uniref:ABC transporter permease n=1 Tax=Saccharicrinis sp. FJH65 TaxID=3344659 RepID=UPI0035F4B597